MYKSLRGVCPDARLYVFAFDDITHNYLLQLDDTHLIPVSLKQFEDPQLLSVKNDRSFAEYCWTSTSSTLLYVLHHFGESHCTYVDADLYFYHSPEILLNEIPKDKDVLITSHQYTARYDQSTRSGKYCVQFMFFRNTPAALEILNWWRDRCIEWCYNRHEDGKFGDQKYLDDWTTRFQVVHEMEHKGALAPWNVQQFKLLDQHRATRANHEEFPVVFYHFHGVKYYGAERFVYAPRSYTFSSGLRKMYYEPYCRELLNLQNTLHFDGMGTGTLKEYLKDYLFKGHIANIRRNWKYWLFKNQF